MVSKKSERKTIRSAIVKEASAPTQAKRGVASRIKLMKKHTEKVKNIKRKAIASGKKFGDYQGIGVHGNRSPMNKPKHAKDSRTTAERHGAKKKSAKHKSAKPIHSNGPVNTKAPSTSSSKK